MKYYADMNDAPVTDLSRQVSIKTENHLIDFELTGVCRSFVNIMSDGNVVLLKFVLTLTAAVSKYFAQ